MTDSDSVEFDANTPADELIAGALTYFSEAILKGDPAAASAIVAALFDSIDPTKMSAILNKVRHLQENAHGS